jgi:hypothetical protein
MVATNGGTLFGSRILGFGFGLTLFVFALQAFAERANASAQLTGNLADAAYTKQEHNDDQNDRELRKSNSKRHAIFSLSSS